MSSNDNDSLNGPLVMLGGVLLLLFIGSLVLKALRSLFQSLALTFDSFGKMAGSFALMIFGILKVIAVVAVIGGVAVAAVYFTAM